MRELNGDKQGKDRNHKKTKLRKFTAFAARGYGNPHHVSAAGRYGGDMIASAKRFNNTRGTTLGAAGGPLPDHTSIVGRSAEGGLRNHEHRAEVEGGAALADFPFWPKGSWGISARYRRR